MKNKKTIYLIDGSAYIHRAYHAITGLSNSTGIPTNAIFGFTRILLKLIKDKSPEYIIMFFDSKGPTFRHQIYEKYKSNRPSMPQDMIVQIPYIKDIVKGLNIPVIEMQGSEADDLIGTSTKRSVEKDFSVVIVTGDKDFTQLVNESIVIWDPMKDKTINKDEVINKYGICPDQIVDFMALCGDVSDNIPGVPGIGEKSASDLIKRFKSIESVYDNIDKIEKKKQRENLINFKDQAFLSKKLVTIDVNMSIDMDFEGFKRKEPDNAKLFEIFKFLDFKQLMDNSFKSNDLSQKTYEMILREDELSDLIVKLKAANIFAVDTETTSVNPIEAEIVGLSFSIEPNKGFYIPCAHNYKDAPLQLDRLKVLEMLKPVLEDETLKKIGQNIKYDWIVLDKYNISLSGVVFDTMIASYLINPTKRAHNLDQIALDFLDHKKISYEELAGKGKNGIGFDQVPLEKAKSYACEDADITFMAYQVLLPKLNELNIIDLFDKIEMPLVQVLKEMEIKGICVDKERLQTLSKDFSYQLDILEEEIYRGAGEKFNIKSSQQLAGILFDKLKLPVQKKTQKKTTYSTDVDVLTFLAFHHEVPALILRHRTLSKLKSSYTDSLIELINKNTRRIHTSFNQTITATGRLSSSEPNLQNIPIRTKEGKEIRKTFVAQEGWSIISSDYSQIELRILAHYSKDPILIKAFLENEDIHSRTAAEVFNIFPALITSDMRRQAKIINFGIIYGMSAFGLSQELGISQKMAKTYIDNYFSRYHGVKEFIDKTIENATKTKQISTLFDRIRLLPDIDSTNKIMKSSAQRTAINTPIQGTAADLIKIAMIRVNQELKKNNLNTAMLLSVHDELVFESPPDELDTAKNLIKEVMESVYDLCVPLKVNIASGKNWEEAH